MWRAVSVWVESDMAVQDLLGIMVSAALLVYLMYALLRPEKF
jgi:K+-transporting ATPase KdpF subunit